MTEQGTDKTATEILNTTPKAFTMLLVGLKVAEERLVEAAAWESKADKAKREEAEALNGKARAERDTQALVAQAAKDADLLTAQAKQEVERVKGEVTLLRGERDTLTGDVADLQATKAKCLEDVKRLTATVATLEAIR